MGTAPRSLTWQSLLMALLCVTADGYAYFHRPAWTITWVGVVTIVAVDAALALPPRYAGGVALAHALVSLSTVVFIPEHVGGLQMASAGAVVAAYLAGAWLRGYVASLALIALIAGHLGGRLSAGFHEEPLRLVIVVATDALLPWLVGRYNAARRAHVDELRHRSEVAVAEAVARERTAIARDLHDVVSHHVSAISMHAGAARLTLTANAATGAVVADSLAAVETSSRAAMADLRKMLDLLHGESDGVAQPGLDNLDELLARTRHAGLPTTLRVHGAARALPSSLDIALYRVVQEMLTNALRHGDHGTTSIEITYEKRSLTLTARNGVEAHPQRAGTARGLAGIRTRVAMFDGTLSYGPGEDGQWTTTVSVPV